MRAKSTSRANLVFAITGKRVRPAGEARSQWFSDRA
jgi:hypothetical protein